MKLHKRYIAHNDLKNATHLEVNVSYSKGGLIYFTGSVSPRGYYLSVTPVTKRDGMISFTMFSGFKKLIFENSRYSAKQFKRAIEIAKDIEAELITAVVDKNKAA